MLTGGGGRGGGLCGQRQAGSGGGPPVGTKVRRQPRTRLRLRENGQRVRQGLCDVTVARSVATCPNRLGAAAPDLGARLHRGVRCNCSAGLAPRSLNTRRHWQSTCRTIQHRCLLCNRMRTLECWVELKGSAGAPACGACAAAACGARRQRRPASGNGSRTARSRRGSAGPGAPRCAQSPAQAAHSTMSEAVMPMRG